MKIVWARQASSDLDEIHDYIARDAPQRATRFLDRLVEATEPLADFPRLGRLVPESDGRLRELQFPPYRILYRVDADQISIVAVVHGKRDLSRLADKPWESSS